MTKPPIHLVVLISGSGTTLQNLIDQIAAGKLDARIDLVIGSRRGLLGLGRAEKAGLRTEIVDRHGGFQLSDFITTGLDPAKHGWDRIKGMFEIEYTIFAGLIGSTFMSMSGSAR